MDSASAACYSGFQGNSQPVKSGSQSAALFFWRGSLFPSSVVRRVAASPKATQALKISLASAYSWPIKINRTGRLSGWPVRAQPSTVP